MRKFLFIGLFLLLSHLFAVSQASSTVVVDISVLVTNMNVQVSWKRSAGYEYSPDMTFFIYRDTKPLTRQTLNQTTFLAEQDASQLIYTETLPDTQPYYYAVLAAYKDGFASGSVVPSVNATSTPTIGRITPQIEKPQSLISNFNVITQINTVIITYSTAEKGNRLVLYRSEKPFINASSLNNALIVASFTDNGTPYTDYPPAGKNFYYAVEEERNIITGTVSFSKGRNTSSYPAFVDLKAADKEVITPEKAQTIRKMPLPDISSSNSSAEGSSLSPDVEHLLQTGFTNTKKTVTQKDKYYFPSETKKYSGGTTELQNIVLQYFESENWAEAEKQLLSFLTTKQGSNTLIRAHFYLGEVYYFQGKKREALLQFMKTQKVFPRESAEWTDAVLLLN